MSTTPPKYKQVSSPTLTLSPAHPAVPDDTPHFFSPPRYCDLVWASGDYAYCQHVEEWRPHPDLR